jgi:hypothetical protein
MSQSSANRLIIASAPILRCAPKLHELPDAEEFLVASRDGEPRGTPRQSRQRDKAPRCSPRFDLYLVHRVLDTSDLKEAKSVLHDFTQSEPGDPMIVT